MMDATENPNESSNAPRMPEALRQLKEECDPLVFPGLHRFFEAIETLYRRDRTINIAVFGQFKAGKSSFLNHITGTNILPVGATPVTNVVTILEYGEEEEVTVFFLDGKRQRIAAREIGEYINEQVNTNNHRQVAKVVVKLPSLKEYRGLRFIDTPGVGSIFSHNTQAALDFTPDTGLAIVAINPGTPLSEEDLRLIRELRTYTPRIYLLLTKTDLYEEKDLQEIERFIRRTMEDQFHQIYPVYRYSVMRNDAHFRQTVLENIIRPMAERSNQLSDEILAYKTRSLARACLSYLEASLEAARKAREDREALARLLAAQREDMERRRQELKVIVQSYTAPMRERLEKILLPHRQEITRKLQEEFDHDYPGWRGNLHEISRRFEQWLASRLVREIDLLAENTRKEWEKLLAEPHKHLTRYLDEARRERNRRLQEVLGITLHDLPIELPLPSLERPDVSVYWAFESNLDLLWFLIPMPLFRKRFGKVFRNRIDLEVEKNIYREISLLTEMLNQSITTMRDATLALLRDDLITAEKILSSHEDETGELEKKIQKISALL